LGCLTALQALLNNEIDEITHKIEALDAMRTKLEENLVKLQEEELELDDECALLLSPVMCLFSFTFNLTVQGVQERIEMEEAATRPPKAAPLPQQHAHHVPSSRRRKGPAFLPSEHDELPPGVAFMVRLH
jgi:division protein 1